MRLLRLLIVLLVISAPALAGIENPGVTGPPVSAAGDLATYLDTTGRILADPGFGSTAGRITNVSTPVSPTDVANKAYVDSIAAGISFVSGGPSLTATTANLTATYSNGTAGVGATLTNSGTQAALTIDGVAMTVADRVLVKDQTTTFQNGIYTVTTVGTVSTNWVLTRATDFDQATAGEVVAGALVAVSAGTTNAGTIWVESGAGPFTIGTTPIIWSRFNAPGAVTCSQLPALTGDISTSAASCVTSLAVVATAGTQAGITWNTKGLVTSGAPGQVNIGTSDGVQYIPNNGSTATVLHKLAILATGTYTATVATTGSTTNVVGICDSGCSTTGNATIAAWGGSSQCIFDGATTAGDWVVASTTVAGDCHDAGATVPAAVQVLGQVESTNGSGGTFNVDLNPVGVSSALNAKTVPGGTNGQIQYNNNSAFGGFTASGDWTINTTTGVDVVGKVDGVTYPASPSVNTVPVVTSATSGGTVTYEAVPNAALVNASTTVNGTTCTLGSTCTVTAVASPNTITLGSSTLTLGGTTTTVNGLTIGTSTLGSGSTQSGTTYTFTSTDCGTTVHFTSSSAVTATVPNSLAAQCNIAVVQDGTGAVTIAAGASATFNANPHGFTKTFGRYAVIGVHVESNAGSAAVFDLLGDGA